MTMVYLAIGWFLGILFAAHAGLPDAVWLAGAVVGAGAAVVLTGRGRSALVVACVAAFFAGGLRHSLAQARVDQGDVATFNGRDVFVEGVVIAEPEPHDTYVALTLEVKAIEPEGEERRAAGGRLRVLAPRFTAAGYGDRVLIKGELETPSEAHGQRAYLAQQGVYSVMAWPEVTRLGRGEGNVLYEAIFTVKARAQATIERLISGQEAALLSGILLGNDGGLSEGVEEDFQTTGMTHIIAISGFNVAILVGVLLMATRPFLGPARAAGAAMTGVALYTLLVGADASVVRAAIMAGAYLLSSRLLGRPTFPYASLCLAGVAMTLVSPLLLWSVGFQLSFAATLGLMLYTDRFAGWTRQRLEGFLTKKTARRAVRALSESTLATLAAQITTLPLILYHFETLSLASLPANLLILPAQPGVMTWGGLATLAGIISPAVGQLFAWVAWLFLKYTTAMVKIMAEMPAATVSLEIGMAGLVSLYVLIGGVTWAAAQKRGRRSRALAVLAQRAPQGAMALA
ncbi:MAG: ComEC/Rec2 family competence protein, partial [Candidatus Promineifilaceae bacterium]|nr:ComEC/Rec2 family competence protein [Candidatus Promineifilaceae bacterium]